MTEEEKNTNQKAEEEKKEDSKPDMTVVMPEAERVTMEHEGIRKLLHFPFRLR